MNAALRELSRIALIYRKLSRHHLANNIYYGIIERMETRGTKSMELALAHYELGESYAEEGLHELAQAHYRHAANIYGDLFPDQAKSPFWYSEVLRSMSRISSSSLQITGEEKSGDSNVA